MQERSWGLVMVMGLHVVATMLTRVLQHLMGLSIHGTGDTLYLSQLMEWVIFLLKDFSDS